MDNRKKFELFQSRDKKEIESWIDSWEEEISKLVQEKNQLKEKIHGLDEKIDDYNLKKKIARDTNLLVEIGKEFFE